MSDARNQSGGRVAAVLRACARLAAAIARARRGDAGARPALEPATAPAAADIEHLRDMHWQASEGHAHYRDLLDAQADLISRRDASGRLTFVNRAYCRAFGVEPTSVLGTTYEPQSLACARNAAGPNATNAADLVETAHGARWIAWSSCDLGPGPDGQTSRQIIGRDVTEERRAAEHLAAARDEAVAATEAKSRFLARMSHEFRTPLGGVLGMAALLRQTSLTEEQASHIGTIEHSARELLKLINEILDLAKVEAGRIDVDRRAMSPCECVQSVVELLAPQALGKGIELAWSMDPGIPGAIESDEARCRQILLNLVGNAIKFTSAGGVRIALRRPTAVTLAIEIHDTGPGIPAEKVDRLFTEFEQHVAATTQRFSGTGLGLAISRHLARALGGDIAVATRAGAGSTFTLTLPVDAGAAAAGSGAAARKGGAVLIAFDHPVERQAIAETLAGAGLTPVRLALGPGAAAAEARARDSGPVAALIVEARSGVAQAAALLVAARAAPAGAQTRGIVVIDTSERAKLKEFRAAGFDAYLVRPVRPLSLLTYVVGADTAATAATGREALSPVAADQRSAPYRVLLVEDNSISALLGMRMLESVGARPQLARSGEDAVAAATSPSGPGVPFDIILMDIHMPGIDGLEAAARIRRHFGERGSAAPPIVALTASAYADDRRQCLASGLEDFMAKPFERQELEAMLEKWCGRRHSGSRDGALDDYAA